MYTVTSGSSLLSQVSFVNDVIGSVVTCCRSRINQHPSVASKQFHNSGRSNAEGGAKSLIEKAVDRKKEKRQISVQEDVAVVKKPPLLRRLWDGVRHTITGFRLFANDIRISSKLLVRSLQGQQLTRRESKLVSVVMQISLSCDYIIVSTNCW